MRRDLSLLRPVSVLVVALAGFVTVGNAHAVIIQLSGTAVDFFYDSTQVGLALFGAPTVGTTTVIIDGQTVIRDTLVFSPAFRAESNDGIGVHTGTPTDILSGNFTFQAVTKNITFVYDQIRMAEFGTYFTNGLGASVDVDGGVQIVDFDDPVFGPTASGILVASDLTQSNGSQQAWNAAGSADLAGAEWDGTKHLLVTMTNNLTAISLTAGTSAWIQKNIVGEGIMMHVDSTVVVPVPAAIWLFGSGLIAIYSLMHRR